MFDSLGSVSTRGRRRREGRRGFSLIELLVVIGVISLLATILSPNLMSIAHRARSTKCLAQLHDIGKAVEIYAGHNRGFVPQSCDQGAEHPLFAAKLLPYLTGVSVPKDKEFEWGKDDPIYKALMEAKIFRCPGVTDESYVLSYVTNAVPFEYYGQNNSYPGDASQASVASQLARLPGSAGEVAYLVEGNLNELGPTDFSLYDVWEPGDMTFNGPNATYAPHSLHAEDNLHQGWINALFYDGNARSRELTPEAFPVTIFNPLDETDY